MSENCLNEFTTFDVHDTVSLNQSGIIFKKLLMSFTKDLIMHYHYKCFAMSSPNIFCGFLVLGE